MNELFEFFLVVGVKSSGNIFIVVLRRFFPDIKSTIENGLRETIPKKAGATITPGVIVPTPESVLGEVGNTSSGVLLLEEVKEVGVFLRRSLTHGRGDEVAREGGRGVDDEKKRKSEGGGDIRKAIIEEREEVEDKDGANGEEDGEAEAERKREFSKRRTEEFTNERDKVEKKVTTEKKEEADESGRD